MQTNPVMVLFLYNLLSIEICNLQIFFDKITDNEKTVTEKAIIIIKISKMVIMIPIVIISEHNIIKNNRKRILVVENIKNMLYDSNDD